MHKIDTVWLIILLIASIFLYDTSFEFSNKYLSCATYQIIDVNKGDSLWTISARYVTDKDDIRSLIAAIKQVNRLDNNTQIYPGQLLKIPVASDNIRLARETN
ncbi:LysM peptidoglycan-binding domain-containing protein [Pelosinus propionicus]|uniref:LysM domain-containing protein n=1 Tax=Pelosinus propionicus DSM 13327 TaxID=1123291 RepID=A0A1I4HDA8_9FIRM|nr:LysM peptidoglycan-binding domain-containing protein [Pelosinus propionicus]SFL39416.1 LysM domain-containing protein [Pelosinus propionicus DSM 13327]